MIAFSLDDVLFSPTSTIESREQFRTWPALLTSLSVSLSLSELPQAQQAKIEDDHSHHKVTESVSCTHQMTSISSGWGHGPPGICLGALLLNHLDFHLHKNRKFISLSSTS